MSDKDSTPKSWGSTVVIGIIILVLAVGLIFFIYYIFIQTNINPFPISPFKFGDTVQISPAVLVKKESLRDTDPNQYLVKNTCSNSPCENCYQEVSAPAGSCVVTFSGNKSDPNTKWVLEQLPYTGIPKQSTQQNVLAFGNRFYLRNFTNSPTELAGRPRMNLFDSTFSCEDLSPDKSFTITSPNLGKFDESACYDPDTNLNQGNELIVYFWPTTQPDLYYILFPGTLNTETRAGSPTLTSRPNDGVVTLRPFSATGRSENTYNPFNPVDSSLFNNGMLLNAQGSPYNTYPVGAKYPAPEVFLFKVVKAS